MRTRHLLVDGVLAVALIAGGPALAQQNEKPEEPGIHPKPEEPQVIRRVNRRMLHFAPYVVASPRAALCNIPAPPTNDEVEPGATDDVVVEPMFRTIGAAHNFAKKNGTVLLRFGSVLKVHLSEHAEGVWYEDASGWLGTLLILDVAKLDTDVDPATVDPEALEADDRLEWRTIGRDGAAAHRVGPSLGHAKHLGVAFRPPRPGMYALRARIYTYALPTCLDDGTEIERPSREEILANGTVAADRVFIRLNVIRSNWEVPDPKHDEPIEEMPPQDLSKIMM